MNKRSIRQLALFSVLLAGIFGLATSAAHAQDKKESEHGEKSEHASKHTSKHAKKAKITLEQARETALREESGTIEGEELEKEHGKLVYSFDIRNSKGTITEIWVDAETGSIAHRSEESSATEAKEKKAESNEKKVKERKTQKH